MRQVPIIPQSSSSLQMPSHHSARRSTPIVQTSYQQRLHAKYQEGLSTFLRNYNPRNRVYSRSAARTRHHQRDPYPTAEEVFIRCNIAGEEDDGFEDLCLTDSISAFTISGRHRVEHRRCRVRRFGVYFICIYISWTPHRWFACAVCCLHQQAGWVKRTDTNSTGCSGFSYFPALDLLSSLRIVARLHSVLY